MVPWECISWTEVSIHEDIYSNKNIYFYENEGEKIIIKKCFQTKLDQEITCK